MLKAYAMMIISSKLKMAGVSSCSSRQTSAWLMRLFGNAQVLKSKMIFCGRLNTNTPTHQAFESTSRGTYVCQWERCIFRSTQGIMWLKKGETVALDNGRYFSKGKFHVFGIFIQLKFPIVIKRVYGCWIDAVLSTGHVRPILFSPWTWSVRSIDW
jgi:hypothetical protein